MSNPFDILTDIVQREIGSTSDKQLSKEHSRIVADTLIKELNEAGIFLISPQKLIAAGEAFIAHAQKETKSHTSCPELLEWNKAAKEFKS